MLPSLLINTHEYRDNLSCDLLSKTEEWGYPFKRPQKKKKIISVASRLHLQHMHHKYFIILLYMLPGENIYCQNIVTFEWRKMIFAVMV